MTKNLTSVRCVLPIRDKRMELLAFSTVEDQEPDVVALVHGYRRTPHHAAVVRFHSACFTGDILGSEKCDCGPQLNAAIDIISKSPWGILIYFPKHEGRGIGLIRKIRAYALQDEGYDTVTANAELHEDIDARNYDLGVSVLKYLGATKIWLLTNSPDKLAALRRGNIMVEGTHKLTTRITAYNRDYLSVKQRVFGHQFESGLGRSARASNRR